MVDRPLPPKTAPKNKPKMPSKRSKTPAKSSKPKKWRKWTHTKKTGGRERINDAIRYYWKAQGENATFRGFWAGYDSDRGIWVAPRGAK